MKKSILIIGGSGSLGSELKKKYNNEDILITYNKNFIKNGVYFDSTNMKIEKIVSNLSNFKYAILLLANKHPNICFKDKKKSNNLNVASIKNILISLKKNKVKPVFLSTDFIFSGRKGNYSEQDKPDPILLYGRQKLEIEKYIMSNFSEYLIFRLSKTFSIVKNDSVGPFYSWVSSFENNEKLFCANDQIYNPVYIEDAAEIIFQVLNKNVNGVFNLAGPKSYSRYQIFKKLYKEYYKYGGKKVELIKSKFNDLNQNLEKWPLNTTMSINKINKLININFLSVEDAVKKTIKVFRGIQK